LKAKEAISELVYLAKCDFVIVKEAARQALISCGKCLKVNVLLTVLMVVCRRGSSDGNAAESAHYL
jgi:hypothetical protein